MNTFFFIAGILFFVLGIVHSFLGEFMIFRDKRERGKLVPSKVSSDLKGRHLRIIWATWHLASIFGWCLGTIVLYFSLQPKLLDQASSTFIIQSIIYTMFLSSIIVLIGTKGKHPGWIVLLVIAILLLLGS